MRAGLGQQHGRDRRGRPRRERLSILRATVIVPLVVSAATTAVICVPELNLKVAASVVPELTVAALVCLATVANRLLALGLTAHSQYRRARVQLTRLSQGL